MQNNTIAILMPGDMGHAVGRALREHGHDVICCLAGRGEHSRQLAQSAGLRDVGTLKAVVEQAQIILSILPPAAALSLANDVGDAIQETGSYPVYVDCNAISPNTAKAVGNVIVEAGAPFIDAGIIGTAPGKGTAPRFYVSGNDVGPMIQLDGKGFQVIEAGPNVGEASGMKMSYAALTKGTWTLHTAVLLAAERLGVRDALIQEFEFSQQAALSAMRRQVPFLPADSARWVGEMEEIANTFADVEVPDGFHRGASQIFQVLEQTPFAQETRADMDRSRSLEEALEVFAQYLPPKE